MIPANYSLQVYNRIEGAKDPLGRPVVTYELGSPLPVIAVAPLEAEDRDTQTSIAEVESLVIYLPKGVTVPRTSQVVWNGFRWNVVEVKSYDNGPWSLGGNTVRIDRRL